MDKAELDAGNILTYQHVRTVNKIMLEVACLFLKRAGDHDDSKLESPEAETFTKYGPKLRAMTYDPNNPSSEYEECRAKMGDALKHHYENNRHHPEYHDERDEDGEVMVDGINNMNLLDLLEMLCDWMAATMRHEDGDINESIKMNTERFGLSPQLARILSNSVPLVSCKFLFD
jgi:hypothetical protein